MTKRGLSWHRHVAFLVLLVGVIAGGCPTSAVGASTPSTRLASAVARIDHFITAAAAHGQFSGSVLIAQAGQRMLDKGYGLANSAQHLPNQPWTRFRIASLTKQFTAMAILLLQEEGKLHIRDHLCQYLASCPVRWRTITLQQLLTHTSGIPDYYNAFDNGRPFTRAQVIAWSQIRPLDFSPGTQFRYSNTGYLLLAAIVEKVSGAPYASFLHYAIFAPLHLRDTGYDENTQQQPPYAVGYAHGTVPARPNYISPGLGDGGLYSTVEDLYRWDAALFTGRFATPASLHAMVTTQVSWACTGQAMTQVCRNGGIGYGYGWFILSDDNGIPMRIIYHGGSMHGFSTSNSYYPAHQLMIIVLSNLETYDPHLIDDAVERVLRPDQPAS